MDKEDSRIECDKGLSSSDQNFKGLCNICGSMGTRRSFVLRTNLIEKEDNGLAIEAMTRLNKVIMCITLKEKMR